MSDLKNFVPSKDNVTVELKVNDKPIKNKDGTTMSITVMSPYSKEYKAVLSKLTNERVKKLSEDKEAGNKVETFEDFSLQLLVQTTVGWNITWDNKKPDFSSELAKEIYEDAFWIKVLINDAQAKLLDFINP